MQIEHTKRHMNMNAKQSYRIHYIRKIGCHSPQDPTGGSVTTCASSMCKSGDWHGSTGRAASGKGIGNCVLVAAIHGREYCLDEALSASPLGTVCRFWRPERPRLPCESCRTQTMTGTRRKLSETAGGGAAAASPGKEIPSGEELRLCSTPLHKSISSKVNQKTGAVETPLTKDQNPKRLQHLKPA